MDVIEKTRELSAALAQDARCLRLQAARAAVETDAALSARTAAWNGEKERLNRLMRQTPRDAQAVAALQKQLSEEYDAVMAHPAMAELKAAQDELNALLSHINSLIQLAVSGEADTSECAGGCADCPGCR